MTDLIPQLSISFPRPVRALHQIEITSRCNLACVYCPSRDIVKGRYPGREALDMDPATYLRALEPMPARFSSRHERTINVKGYDQSIPELP